MLLNLFIYHINKINLVHHDHLTYKQNVEKEKSRKTGERKVKRRNR